MRPIDPSTAIHDDYIVLALVVAAIGVAAFQLLKRVRPKWLLTPRPSGLIGIAFAVVVLAPVIVAVVYGVVGSRGNSTLTGAFIAWAMLLLGLASLRPSRIQIVDVVFLLFVICVGITFALNPISSSQTEIVLFGFALAAYPVARSVSFDDLPALRSGMLWVAAAIVGFGMIPSTLMLIARWNESGRRLNVFGPSVATTLIAITLGFVLLVAVTDRLTPKKAAIWALVLFVPTYVYAACLVRHAFVFMFAAAILAAILLPDRRRLIMAMMISPLIAASLGVVTRPGGLDYARQVIGTPLPQVMETSIPQAVVTSIPQAVAPSIPQAIETPLPDAAKAGAPASSPPSCSSSVDLKNTISLREALLMDAVALVRIAGPFGLGLDSFAQHTCLSDLPPHNITLQALAEFGWMGGGLLMLLIVLVVARLVPLARKNPSATFLLCALAYVFALSQVTGRISRDLDLFLLLGAGAGVVAAMRPARLVAKPESISPEDFDADTWKGLPVRRGQGKRAAAA